MHGAIPPLPQYAFMVWCSVKKAQGLLYLCLLSWNLLGRTEETEEDHDSHKVLDQSPGCDSNYEAGTLIAALQLSFWMKCLRSVYLCCANL
jgi:hypothetical protein